MPVFNWRGDCCPGYPLTTEKYIVEFLSVFNLRSIDVLVILIISGVLSSHLGVSPAEGLRNISPSQADKKIMPIMSTNLCRLNRIHSPIFYPDVSEF